MAEMSSPSPYPDGSEGMPRRNTIRIVLLVGIVAAWLLAGPSPAQERGRKKSEPAGDAIAYSEPAPEMQRVSLLVGRWSGRQTWSEPERYKRGRYEGYPGDDGHVVRTVELGPGGFSLAWTDEGRGPMGPYRTRAMLSWDPKLRVYVLDTVHSLFPGISRVSGGDAGGALLFRGEDDSTGRTRTLRVTWKGLSEKGWTETVEASERGEPFRPVVTVSFERADQSAAAPARP